LQCSQCSDNLVDDSVYSKLGNMQVFSGLRQQNGWIVKIASDSGTRRARFQGLGVQGICASHF
jgi:hypothetical protein